MQPAVNTSAPLRRTWRGMSVHQQYQAGASTTPGPRHSIEELWIRRSVEVILRWQRLKDETEVAMSARQLKLRNRRRRK